MNPLIECVPNFSEGCNMETIKQITKEIESVEGVKLIDTDPGKATNRTVVTFVGPPGKVCEAAFRAAKKAIELIDMRQHKGTHPRFGALDVCPLIPVANITMSEVTVFARKLAQRLGTELRIPVYCYEFAAFEDKRKNLANCRQGEYESLPQKLESSEWKPDFGPNQWNEDIARSGATAVGARNFLIAFNVNLNTTSIRRANSVAFDVRERGRIKREADSITGKIVKNKDGDPVYEPGLLKAVKGLGWYIDEYGIAQISMNLTNLSVTPLHVAFDTVCERATVRGLRVTGSELVGVVPLTSMLDAGKYFLKKQKRSTGIPESEIVKMAIQSLGLNELYQFNPRKKIIEYILEDASDQKKLTQLTLEAFANKTASEAPAPGGGSVSAYLGVLGASLGIMVANLSSHKRGWDHRWEEFSNQAEKGMKIQGRLLELVDEDTRAFNAIMNAYSLPKNSGQEKEIRSLAIHKATIRAIEVPFEVMKLSLDSFDIIKYQVEHGNPNSVSDAGVGALCARSAILGAGLNIKINGKTLKENPYINDLLLEAEEIGEKAILKEQEILSIVNQKITNS